MKLSVAMCTYNGARYLPEQLASIAAQRRPPDELVVCDDYSSDTTRELLKQFKAQAAFPVRLYFNEQKLRVLRNFAKAISLCEGDIIALCDQDDVWLPEKLSRMAAEFAQAPEVGLVFSDLEVVDKELQPLGFNAWQSHWVDFGLKEQRRFKQGKALDVLLTRNVITGAGAVFRREFIDLVLPFPEVSGMPLLHDYWLGLMISTVAPIVPISTPLVKYRIHGDQQMSLSQPRAQRTAQQEARGKRDGYQVSLKILECVAGRLAERATQESSYWDLSRDLQQRLEHARVRARLSQHRFHQRLRLALRERAVRRYHRYPRVDASAWQEFFEDVLPYSVVELMESFGIGTPADAHTLLAASPPRSAKAPVKDE